MILLWRSLVMLVLLAHSWCASAQAAECRWFAANDQKTLYERADEACRGYIQLHGWNPPGYVYDSARYWSPTNANAGAQCRLRYRPDLNSQGEAVNLYNTAPIASCTDSGLCPLFDKNAHYGCGKAVSDLLNRMKPGTDPTSPFHKQQTCIARISCDLRCKMDNCRWMERVIPDFTHPYLDRNADWGSVESTCHLLKKKLVGIPGGDWIADKACFSAMGLYHVRVDLLGAVSTYGCGSENDWDMVGSRIAQCLAETMPEGDPLLNFGSNFIARARSLIRTQCVNARNEAGVPTDINLDLKGKTCDQPPSS